MMEKEYAVSSSECFAHLPIRNEYSKMSILMDSVRKGWEDVIMGGYVP